MSNKRVVVLSASITGSVGQLDQIGLTGLIKLNHWTYNFSNWTYSSSPVKNNWTYK
ncbi:13225_t:CDS:2, partial [Funneliformis mosseae]